MRADRSSLPPVDEDSAEARASRHATEEFNRQESARVSMLRGVAAIAPGVKLCACGCGGILPARRRRKDGRLGRGQRGVIWLRGHHLRGRA